MLSSRLAQLKEKASARVLDIKGSVQKKWEEMQEAPENVPEHWEEHTDEAGNKFFIDTSNGEMYRMNKRQHKRIDTIEKISLVEQMSKSPTSPINEQAARQEWECPQCTLKNPGQATHCGACDTARPPEAEPKTPSNLKDPNKAHSPNVASPSESNNNNNESANNGNSNNADNNDQNFTDYANNNNNNNSNNDNNLNNNNLNGNNRPESASFNNLNDEDEKNEELLHNDPFITDSAMNGNVGNNTENRDSLMVPNGVNNGNNGNNNDYSNNIEASHSPQSTMEQINAAIGASLKSMGNAEIDELNAGERSILLQFCDITDATADVALKYLSEHWNLDQALTTYFDDNPNHPKSRQISAQFGVDDINRILDDDGNIAPDSDLIVQSGGNGGDQKRGSVDMGQPPQDEEEPLIQRGDHNRLTTEENIHVAQIASLQQAQFDKEVETLRRENERLVIENESLQTELTDARETIDSLKNKLDSASRREDGLIAEKNAHVQEREQFQKDWDRMNNTFAMIVDELNKTSDALKQGDQTQINKLDELIQQVENLRSPMDYFQRADGQDGNENSEQKQSMHGRTQSRSYETFHKQKSSDPTYDKRKPAHTRTEHSRGPSFTLSKDIFNGGNGENVDINEEENANKSDEDEMRRDSIAKSEADEDMIAVIAYYELGDNEDEEEDGMHSRDSSWFGDYGRLPTSRRVSQKTPSTVKELFDMDSNSNALANMNSNGIQRGLTGKNDNNGNNGNYAAMKEHGHGKRSSAQRASHGVNIQPTILETTEENDNLGVSTVRELFADEKGNGDNKKSIDEAIANQEKAHDLTQNDAGFNASNLTPISTESGRPSRAARTGGLGDVFNNVGAPNFAELEKSHLTPVSVHSTMVGGIHGINDGPNEEKQRSRSDEEVEQELRSKIRKEMEAEFASKEESLRSQLREEIIKEVEPKIVNETASKMEEEFENKLQKELDVVRSELQNSFEFQLKSLRNELKESEENHKQEVRSLENTKLDLIRSTSEEIQTLRDVIKQYFSKASKSSNGKQGNSSNVQQVFQMFFNK